jgi:hypothetical protein
MAIAPIVATPPSGGQLPDGPGLHRITRILPPGYSKIICGTGFSDSYASPDEWKPLIERAARENAIEKAILATNDWFASGDIQRASGHKPSDVGYMLGRFVEERRLERTGTKRGTMYRLPPTRPLVIMQRSDWTD